MKIKLTELNSGYRGERRVPFLTEKNRPKAIIVLTVAALFIFTFFLSSVGIIPIDALVLKAKVGITGNDQRFPLGINSESTLDIGIIGESIVMLTTENVAVYSENGRMVFSEPHVFAKPGITINGDKAVVFDRGGKGYILINEKKTVHKANADNTIITAEYGEKGNYAIATKGAEATSTLTVLNKFNSEIFKWNCAYEHIVDIALSPNGKYAGVAVMGAENGRVFTTVQYFGFDYNEPLNTQKILGSASFDLEFTGFNKLTLISNNGTYIIARKAEKFETVKEYYSTEFNSCQMSSGEEYIVTLAKYASKNNFEINLFKPNGKLKATINSDTPIITTCISDKYIFALSESFITVYNFSGKEVSKINFKGEAHSIYATDNFIFISSLDKITRCFSYGDAEIEL